MDGISTEHAGFPAGDRPVNSFSASALRFRSRSRRHDGGANDSQDSSRVDLGTESRSGHLGLFAEPVHEVLNEVSRGIARPRLVSLSRSRLRIEQAAS